MDEIYRAVEQLLGRASGPLHIRLLIQPAIAVILAIRAGLKDAREKKPPFLWDFMTTTANRRALVYSVCNDIGKLFIGVFIIDAIYQLTFLKSFYLIQALIVTLVLALLPYIILRGIVTRLANRLGRQF